MDDLPVDEQDESPVPCPENRAGPGAFRAVNPHEGTFDGSLAMPPGSTIPAEAEIRPRYSCGFLRAPEERPAE